MRAYGMSDIGKERPVNQDFIFYSVAPVGNLPNLFVVADGMGGHKAGDVASRYAVNTFVEYIKNSEDTNPITLIDEGIRLANNMVVGEAATSTDYAGMGTTFVVAVIYEGCAYIANVGDSRLYLINDEIKQITRDHSLVEEMVSLGELDRKNARTHEKKNVITRAIGAEKSVIPDFFEIEYEPGDKFLLCTDGLCNMIDDQRIKQLVCNYRHVEEAVDALVEEANGNGGKDNVSVVLVQTQYKD